MQYNKSVWFNQNKGKHGDNKRRIKQYGGRRTNIINHFKKHHSATVRHAVNSQVTNTLNALRDLKFTHYNMYTQFTRSQYY